MSNSPSHTMEMILVPTFITFPSSFSLPSWHALEKYPSDDHNSTLTKAKSLKEMRLLNSCLSSSLGYCWEYAGSGWPCLYLPNCRAISVCLLCCYSAASYLLILVPDPKWMASPGLGCQELQPPLWLLLLTCSTGERCSFFDAY